MQLPPGLEHPSAELHEEWLIYMQLPPGLEHPSAELHEEWLIYMQLPPGLEHPSAELHEEWLIYICNYHQVMSIHQQSYMKNGLYIYAITTRS